MIKFLSIRQIMDDLLDHPLLQDLNIERAVNYAVDFIKIVGMPQVFTEKEVTLKLDNHKCVLPCDFVEVIQVKDDKDHSYRYTSDTFHFTRDEKDTVELTYKLQNNVLFSSKKDGVVNISYRAIEVDDDGFPLIPDNSSFKEALELYIKKKWFTVLFDLNKISAQSLQNAQTEYAWYVGQAQSDLVRPSLDQMESITNMWNQLLTKANEHNKQYLHTGSREYLKRH